MELETILRVLIKKWRIIVPLFLVTFFATLLFTKNEQNIYQARATYIMRLSPTITDNREFATVMNTLSGGIEIPATYAEVADSRRLKTLAGKKLNLPPEVLNHLSVDSHLIPGTNIIEVVVEGTDPIQVRNFANAIGDSTIEYVQDLYETFTLVPLDAAIAPSMPIRPRVALNLILGGILGLVLGICIALVIYFYETSEKNPDQIPYVDVMPKESGERDLSIMDLRRDLLSVHERLESTTLALNQIQVALRQTISYSKDIRSAVYDLENHFDGNHIEVEEKKEEKKRGR